MRWDRPKTPPSAASGRSSASRLRPALLQRPLQERLELAVPWPEHEHVPRHEDHRHGRQDVGAGALPADARLEREERQHGPAALAVAAEREQLAVEDPVPGEVDRARDDLRVAVADLVEVAAVEADLRSAPVELGADAVVLVLDPDGRPEAAEDLGGVLGRGREHELERVEEPGRGLGQAVVVGQRATMPTSPVSWPARFTSTSGRSNASARAASRSPSRRPMRRSPPSTLTTYLAVSGSHRRSRRLEPGGLGGRTGRLLHLRERLGHLGERRLDRRVARGRVGRPGRPRRPCQGRSGGRRPRRGASRETPATLVTAAAIAAQPSPASGRRLGNGRPVEKMAATGNSSALSVAEVVGQEAGLLRGPGGGARHARRPRSSGAWPGWYTSEPMPAADVVPRGTRRVETVVLRRHRPENLAAFRRWYSDAEVARLTRYRDGPMRLDEIDRFFTARVLGIDSLTFAVHLRAKDRLIGSCAFSQLDTDNGSAMFHITIGEKDMWGHGYGTEATRLMLAHAFTNWASTASALAVFAFNERAIRSYEKVRLRGRGAGSRGDLPRRPLLGRDRHEHARIRVAGDPGARRSRHVAGPGREPVDLVRGIGAPAGADGERRSGRGGCPGHVPGDPRGEGPRGRERAAGGRGARGGLRGRDARPDTQLDQMLADLMVALEQDEGQSSVARAPKPPDSSAGRSPANSTTPEGLTSGSPRVHHRGMSQPGESQTEADATVDANVDLLPIGRFARLAGLSVGALRHYDELDLLRPADVDRFTGYRRYRRDQLETARTIARLRDLEMPIDEIRELLATDDPEGRQHRLAIHRGRVEARTAGSDAILHIVGQLSQGKGPIVTDTAAASDVLDEATHRRLGIDLFNHTWTPDRDGRPHAGPDRRDDPLRPCLALPLEQGRHGGQPRARGVAVLPRLFGPGTRRAGPLARPSVRGDLRRERRSATSTSRRRTRRWPALSRERRSAGRPRMGGSRPSRRDEIANAGRSGAHRRRHRDAAAGLTLGGHRGAARRLAGYDDEEELDPHAAQTLRSPKAGLQLGILPWNQASTWPEQLDDRQAHRQARL